MRDLPNRALEVFSEAIELPAHERAVFLQQAYAGDEELRQRVAALLAAHDRVGDFLEDPLQKPPVQKNQEAPVGEQPGDRIGRYKLLQQIGEGGWGVVYMAEQEEPVRRRVALKIIKQGMDTKSVIARFEAERQALALMDHPNIAKVFDAGATESGRPFFVMELVRGVKITEFCDQNSLSTRERLELFVQVCRAVQHAHQKGIIHRDIKPSNILVTTNFEGAALPVVIDFGIAKATSNQRLTNKTLFTAFDMLIGTPAYMSPEQAAFTNFDVDTRTDIYSLGVLLYELLTGSTPFDVAELMKTGLDEVRRVIREQEPVRPSTRLSRMAQKDLTNVAQHRNSEAPLLIRSVKGDLDWIAMKALEKDRTRRYETATSLALDIQRFLADETVLARPPSTLYRFRKALSRNKVLFGGVGIIALLLVVGLAFVSVAFARERQARREADAALRQAQAEKEHAQAESAKSRQVTQFLEDMLNSVGPSVALGQDTTMLRGVLDKAAARVGTGLTNQFGVEAELRSLIGQVYYEIGEYDQAEKMHRAALALNRKLFGSDSGETASSLNCLGMALYQERRLGESEAAAQEALRIRRRLYGEASPVVADSLNNLAGVYRRQGRLAESEAVSREALGIREAWFGKDSPEAADSLHNLIMVLGIQGEQAEAEATARKLLELRRREHGNDDPTVAAALSDLSWAVKMNGDKSNEAESLEGQALAMQERVLGDQHPDVAKSISTLGELMREQGNLTVSDTVLSAVLSIQLKLLGEDDPATLETLRNLGQTLESEGKWAEAESAYRRVLGSWRKGSGAGNPQTFSDLEGLVSTLMNQKKFGEAERMLDATLTPALIKDPASAYLLTQRIDLLGREGRWQEAATDNALLLQYQPTDHYHYHIMAGLLAITQDRPAYEKLCQTILAKFGDTTNPFIAERMSKDCLLLPDSGMDLQRVNKLADTAVTAGIGHDNGWGMPWFVTAKALSNYRQGHFTEATDWAKKSHDSSQPLAVAQADAILALAYWQLGQKDKARDMLAEGNELAPRISPGHAPIDLGGSWVAWLIARIQLDEAAKLIQSVPVTEDSSN